MSSLVTEAVDLLRGCIGVVKEDAGFIFSDFVQYLLCKTVLKEGSSVYSYSTRPNRVIISGRQRQQDSGGREAYESLPLNNGKYLFVYYDNFIDPKDQFLKTAVSKLTYQNDLDGVEQHFRFEYVRIPPNHYPRAHVHVYGSWQYDGISKDMDKFHIPVLRSTLESVIRMLHYECGVATNCRNEEWEPMLAATEREFSKIVSTRTPKEETDQSSGR